MNSLRSIQHSETVAVLWTGYTGMLICAALGSRPSDRQKAFRPGPGGVKNIAM